MSFTTLLFFIAGMATRSFSGSTSFEFLNDWYAS
jgi:hypothetical protein